MIKVVVQQISDSLVLASLNTLGTRVAFWNEEVIMITFTKSSGSKSTISFMKRGRDGTSNVVNEGNFRSCFPAQQKHKLVSLPESSSTQ